MIVSRFMVVFWVALLIVASLSLGAIAATTAYASQPHCSSMVSPDHDTCDDAGIQDTGCEGC